MPFDLSRHPYFTSWTDPQSGVESFILTDRVAPVQQSFYYTNPSLSADGRWLWFYCAHPPNPVRTLAAVCMDPAEPRIEWFPEAGFDAASPMLATEGDAAYFTAGPTVFKKTLGRDGVEAVCTLADEYVANRQLEGLATHLSLSADGRYFLLDGRVGLNTWFVAMGEPATGEVRLLHELDRRYNHALFSPVDANLCILSQDWMFDPHTGQATTVDIRTWLMDVRQTRFEPLVPGLWFKHNAWPCHEWFSADGLVCWTDYEAGVFECDPAADAALRKAVHVWPRALCHSHCDPTRRYYVADQTPYKWHERPCEVLFFDRQTGKETHIVTALPPRPPLARSPRLYHIDPHPQVSPDGAFVVYTTTVRGAVDVAVAPLGAITARL